MATSQSGENATRSRQTSKSCHPPRQRKRVHSCYTSTGTLDHCRRSHIASGNLRPSTTDGFLFSPPGVCPGQPATWKKERSLMCETVIVTVTLNNCFRTHLTHLEPRALCIMSPLYMYAPCNLSVNLKNPIVGRDTFSSD